MQQQQNNQTGAPSDRNSLAQFMRRMVDELQQDRSERAATSPEPVSPTRDEEKKAKKISSLLRIGL